MTGPAPQNVADQTITNTLTVIAPEVAPSVGLFQLSNPLTEAEFLRLQERSSILAACAGAVPGAARHLGFRSNRAGALRGRGT
jgi:hypothetical protein